MKSLLIGVVGLAALALAIPSETLAQDRRDGRVIVLRSDNDDDDLEDILDVVFDDDDFDRRHFRTHKKGPKFCRTGAGHPVFGRQWCREKGFGLGDRRHIRGRGDRGGIIFRGEDGSIVIDRDGDIVFRPRRLLR